MTPPPRDSRRVPPPAPRPPRRPGPAAAPGRGDEVAHIYLLLGGEDVRAEERLEMLLDELLPPEERALNLDVLEGGEISGQDLITRLETLPFFGARRVVVVRRGEQLRPPDQDALAAFLEQGPPPAALILLAASLDRRRRLYAALARAGRIVPCGPLDPEDLPAWIVSRVRAQDKTIAPDAARLLVTLVGGGLRELGLEIDKLAAYAGDRTAITAADVSAVASHVAEATVFELMDAVGHRQVDRALGLLQTVLTMGEAPLRVLYLLEDQTRMLARTKALMDRRAPRAEVRDALGTRAWLYDRYREQVAAFGRLDVPRMLGLLVEADGMIKTGQMPPRLAVETLIVSLCLGATPGGSPPQRPAPPAGA